MVLFAHVARCNFLVNTVSELLFLWCHCYLYRHWSSAAPSLQLRGCADGTAGTEAFVSPSPFPVGQSMRETAVTLPNEAALPPALTRTPTQTHWHQHKHVILWESMVAFKLNPAERIQIQTQRFIYSVDAGVKQRWLMSKTWLSGRKSCNFWLTMSHIYT